MHFEMSELGISQMSFFSWTQIMEDATVSIMRDPYEAPMWPEHTIYIVQKQHFLH